MSSNTFEMLKAGPENGLDQSTNKGLGPGPDLENFMGLNTGPNAVPTDSDFMSNGHVVCHQPYDRDTANRILAEAEVVLTAKKAERAAKAARAAEAAAAKAAKATRAAEAAAAKAAKAD